MYQMPLFQLEEFWKKYEFSSPYLLCPSDAESWQLKDILEMADEEAKSLWDNLHLGYTESPGLPLLREEIAKLYPTLSKENILTTAGAEEGIYCTLRTLISPGDHVVAVLPTYQSLHTIPDVIGADISTIQLKPENRWKLDFSDIQNVWRPNTKVLILVCPHNPTGTLIEKDVYNNIISLARSTGTHIFCDEVYRFLELDESKRLPSFAESYERGISLNVMTKSFGLPGLRIGWVASQDTALLSKINGYKMYTSICNSAPSEILSIIALRSKEQILERNRRIVLKNVEQIDGVMHRNSNALRWIRPEGGTIGFVELLLPTNIDEFAEKLVRERGVLIMPASVLGYSGNYFRIGFGRQNMPDILNRFEDYLCRTYFNS